MTKASASAEAVGGRPRWKIAIGIVVVALILGAGGTFAYLKFFGETPDQRVARAVSAAVAAKSFEYSGSLRIEGVYDRGANRTLAVLSATNAAEQPVKLLLTMEGAYDRLDPANPKSRSAFTLATTEALGGAPLGTLEIRHVDDVTYLSLTRVPEIPLVDLSPLAGVWVKFDSQVLKGLIPSATATTETATPSEVSPEQREAIKAAYLEIRPVTVTETLKDEDVNGVASKHYRLEIDKDKLRTFLLRTQGIMGDTTSLAYEKTSDDYDKFSKNVNVETMEIWIGKAEGLPTRFLLRGAAVASEDVPGEGVFTLDATFKNFGKAIQIEAPQDAKGIEEIFGMLTGGMGAEMSVGSSSMPEKEDVIRLMATLQGYERTNGRYPSSLSDLPEISAFFTNANPYVDYQAGASGRTFGLEITYMDNGKEEFVLFTHDSFTDIQGDNVLSEDRDGLSEFREFVYDTDPLKPDTDGDGFSDGDEVDGGYDPNGPGKFERTP